MRLFALLLLLAACATPEFPTATPGNTADVELRPEDIAVYEGMFQSYAEQGAIAGLTPPPPPPPGTVVKPLTAEERSRRLAEVKRRSAEVGVALHPRTEAPMVEIAPLGVPPVWWAPGGGERIDLIVPHAAAQDLNLRNRRHAPTSGYRSNVLAFSDRTDRWTIRLSLPGYSLDGRAAMVVLSASCSNCVPHLGMTSRLLYLRKVDDRWTVMGEFPRWHI